jgi:ketosteroid isomerase-like protein
MVQPHHDPAFCTALGQQWIDAWNSRDLERVLALYADDAEMTSDKIPLLGFDPTGTVHGKDALRAYWRKGLDMLPNLHFTLIDVYVSPDSLVVFYSNERGAKICEYLRLNADGKIRQGSANHLVH